MINYTLFLQRNLVSDLQFTVATLFKAISKLAKFTIVFGLIFITLISHFFTNFTPNPKPLSSDISIDLQNLYGIEIKPQEKITNFVFDPKNPSLLVFNDKKVEIKLGESNYTKESATALAFADKQRKIQRDVIALDRNPAPSNPDLATKRDLVKNAASKYGIDWHILEAVWQVESGKSWDTSKRSYAGATGPMQFLPSTFRNYAPSGASIYSASDSLDAAANLLASAGAKDGDIDSALYSYNHSSSYVAKVKRIASEIRE